MVGDLLSDVVADGAIWIIVATAKYLAQHRVVPTARSSVHPDAVGAIDGRLLDPFRLDVPTGQIVPNDLDESLLGTLNRSGAVIVPHQRSSSTKQSAEDSVPKD